MFYKPYIFAFIFLISSACSSSQGNTKKESPPTDSIIKIEMNLSAFGVESDDFPSIAAYIDFQKDSSNCKKSFYNPAYKDSTYSLTKIEIQKVLKILLSIDLEKLKKEYTVQTSDQPTSTTIIYTTGQNFITKDYGLKGEYPLQELYKTVYKF
jgi:hypothetical protein